MRAITQFTIEANNRGEYDKDTLYVAHDLVTSGGNYYLSVVPSKGADLKDTNYWMAMVKGKKGDPGNNGLSAYQLAVQELGFSGSVKDWLSSLKGEKGDPGSPGKVDGLINAVDYTKYKDMDALTSGSVFFLSQKLDNQPVAVTSSFLFVLSNADSSVVTQIFIDPAADSIYMRSKVSDKWSDWKWVTQW